MVFKIGRHAARKAPGIFQDLFPGRTALIIADQFTWPILGERLSGYFRDAGIPVEAHREETFRADWEDVERLDALLDAHPQAILVAVGGGVINDLCKLCSYHHGQAYMTLPMAASVDGYAAFGASVTYEGTKQHFDCPQPAAMIADIDVLASAPAAMTSSGYADLAAKIPAGGEWMVADCVGTDPIQPEAWSILQDKLDEFLSRPAEVAAGNPDAIAAVFEGLTLSGVAMQIAKSSRPASCCEHQFSHYLDMTGHRFEGRPVSHGFQVGIGTLAMCAVFDNLLQLDLTQLDVEACAQAWPSLEEEQERALKLFEDFPAPRLGYEEVTKKYQDADAVRTQLTRLKANWPRLKEQLREQVYPYEKMYAMLRTAGAPCEPEQIGLTRQQLHDMFPRVQLMHYRYNLLDLARRGRFYDAIVEPLFAPGGPFAL